MSYAKLPQLVKPYLRTGEGGGRGKGSPFFGVYCSPAFRHRDPPKTTMCIGMVQAEAEKLRAELSRSQAEARQLQQRCSEQLAAAEREAAAKGAESDAALRAAREEHSRAVAQLLEERQAVLDATHKKMLESEAGPLEFGKVQAA